MATAHADAVLSAADTPIVGVRRWQDIVEVQCDTLRADARTVQRAVRRSTADAVRILWDAPRPWLASWRRMTTAGQALALAARIPVLVPSPPTTGVWTAAWPSLLLEHACRPTETWTSATWGTSDDEALQMTRFASARMRGIVFSINRADGAFTPRGWLAIVEALAREGRVLGIRWHGWLPETQASLEAAGEALLCHGLRITEIPWTPSGMPADPLTVTRAVTRPLLPLHPVNLRNVDESMLARVPGIGRDAARRIVEGRKVGAMRSRNDLVTAGVDLRIATSWLDLAELPEAYDPDR
jgi:hypothetical protein